MSSIEAGPLAELASRVRPSLNAEWRSLRTIATADPNVMRDQLAEVLRIPPDDVIVTGTLDRRLVIARESGRWWAADLAGLPHDTRLWPAWATDEIELLDASESVSALTITEKGLRRLLHPRLHLVALYHPENFPLPRFPLGISDVARAARATLLGRVSLQDMQLGVTVEDIIDEIDRTKPQILGISATFGQHDLMCEVLDHVESLQDPPLVVAGGSLTVRNERGLIERYPRLLVARGAGEPTIQDVLSHWHGDLSLDQIRGIGYQGAPRGEGALGISVLRRNATVANRMQTDILPELDLLDATFNANGVAQLETSRGCTNYCSFCPRGHKGAWSGSDPSGLSWILTEMRKVFDRHPRLSRTLYLVDEEFIGRGPGAESRAVAVADAVHDAGFAWETSCRIDQIVDPVRDHDWHVQRATLWRDLLDRGLRRCLFGVESGVTSILERFNKETTGEQNALAIRTLSALGVPTRFTYITFDQLMTKRELDETYAFQGRTDLLLRKLDHLSAEEIVEGVRDEDFVARHSLNSPFHSEISYMLVSMECLVGAAYTKQVHSRGLTGEVNPAMGRVDARFADWRIGSCSHHAQLWVDRNFALDYMLKSLEKILDGAHRRKVRGVRSVFKAAAYRVFGMMVEAVDDFDVNDESGAWLLEERIRRSMDAVINELQKELDETASGVVADLPMDQAVLLHDQLARWREVDDWSLINLGDPCGS